LPIPIANLKKSEKLTLQLLFAIHGDTMVEHAVSLQETIGDHHRSSADQLAV
jgi:hypothetical protein